MESFHISDDEKQKHYDQYVHIASLNVNSHGAQMKTPQNACPLPFPSWPSGMCHMTFPVPWLKSLLSSSCKSTSKSPNATFEDGNDPFCLRAN